MLHKQSDYGNLVMTDNRFIWDKEHFIKNKPPIRKHLASEVEQAVKIPSI